MRLTRHLLGKLVGLLTGAFAAQVMLTTLGHRRPDDLHVERECKGSGAQVAARSLDTSVQRDWTAEAPRRVRIYCLILTHPKQYAGMAVLVNNTWARRCDKYYFVGSERTNINIPLLYLPLSESRRILWKKVRMSFEAVHAQEHLSDFDYFLKADDDTYVVMENLREMLGGRDPNEATVFGRRFAYQGHKDQQYMSGGAGYVLSRQALRRLVSVGFAAKQNGGKIYWYCNNPHISVEDYLMGRCLAELGVKFEDSLDSLGREKFHPLRPETMVFPERGPNWLTQYNYHPFNMCVTCISDRTISFHYIQDLYEMEFLIYHMRVAK